MTPKPMYIEIKMCFPKGIHNKHKCADKIRKYSVCKRFRFLNPYRDQVCLSSLNVLTFIEIWNV